jgi:hypothetical protein
MTMTTTFGTTTTRQCGAFASAQLRPSTSSLESSRCGTRVLPLSLLLLSTAGPNTAVMTVCTTATTVGTAAACAIVAVIALVPALCSERAEHSSPDLTLLMWLLVMNALTTTSFSGLDLQEKILVVLVPQLEAKINAPNWLYRESALLALGAISEGCWRNMRDILPNIIPGLLKYLKVCFPFGCTPIQSLAPDGEGPPMMKELMHDRSGILIA